MKKHGWSEAGADSAFSQCRRGVVGPTMLLSVTIPFVVFYHAAETLAEMGIEALPPQIINITSPTAQKQMRERECDVN